MVGAKSSVLEMGGLVDGSDRPQGIVCFSQEAELREVLPRWEGILR